MFREIKDFPRNVKYGVKNLVKWFPVIWKDRDWDHQFIYYILRHKLHLTEQHIRNYGHHTRNIQDADNIKLCVDLLDRITKDEYHDNAFKTHYEKWGEMEFNTENKFLKITHKNVITEKDKMEERKGFKRLCKKVDNLENQDLELLFKTMRKHIQSWWD